MDCGWCCDWTHLQAITRQRVWETANRYNCHQILRCLRSVVRDPRAIGGSNLSSSCISTYYSLNLLYSAICFWSLSPTSGVGSRMKLALLIGSLSVHLLFAQAPVQNRLNGRYLATAYSVTGITASGDWTKRHFVAADPDILPIGSRIKVLRAGRYSGEYVVADTGVKIQGRRLDIYMPNEPECKKFGVKPVRIRVLQLGDGTKQAVKEADKTVSEDVNKDVAHGKVGGAATEIDWNKKGASVAAAAKADAAATPSAVPSRGGKPIDANTASQPH